jgi:pyridinium-3,5-bisthiocarboxylic acid mononucleotide nickel chelatase
MTGAVLTALFFGITPVCAGRAIRLIGVLQVDSVSASRVTVGRGMVKCAHGTFTVPAPATLEILSRAGIPYEQGEQDGEFLTPTGAALLAAMAESFGNSPALRPERTGYGAGANDYEGHANLFQATLGICA